MRALFLPTAALVCCLASGCVRESDRVQTVTRTFLTALSQGNGPEAQKVATLAARPYLAEIKPGSQSAVRTGFTLGSSVVVKENTAEVPVTFIGDDSKPYPGAVFLRREENEWRVWGLRVKLASHYELILDFEHPERMVGELLGVAVGELSKGLEGLSKSTEKAGRAMGEALGGFLRGFSESLERTAPQDSLEPPVVR